MGTDSCVDDVIEDNSKTTATFEPCIYAAKIARASFANSA